MKKLQRWDDSFSTGETNEILSELASVFLKQNPLSREHAGRIADLLRNRDWRGIVDYEVDYASLSLSDARGLRQVKALFEKRADIVATDVDRRSAALQTFCDAEARCYGTNNFFRALESGSVSIRPDVHSVLYTATRKVSEVLGELPRLDQLRLRFGPGATTRVQKKNAAPRVKLGMPFTCSSGLLPYVDSVLEQLPGWIIFDDSDSVHVPVTVDRGRITTVPKTWKTDRSIAIEPVLNIMCQLGIGDYIADRLRKVGQDIRDSERNSEGARRGSLGAGLATLDLSSASDTVATGLVYHLLPIDWALSLDSMRTSEVEISLPGIGDNLVMPLQKFSTMGNGFTFPLETLIFYALTYACVKHTCPHRVSEIQVYGDDIIVPIEADVLLKRVLNVCGFEVNHLKSFSSGPFRESCGADYYLGNDIRPVYVKDSLSGMSIYTLHNFFRRKLEEECADFLLQYLSDEIKLFGPDGYGDGVLLPPFGTDPPLERFRAKDGWGGYTFDMFTSKGRRLTRSNLPGDRFLPAYSIYARESTRNHDWNGDPVLFDMDSCLNQAEYTYKRGVLSCALPGTAGYKRISVYTFGVGISRS